MKNAKGFSLIELLIVVVIIGIVAAIAIPNIIAAKRAGNEGSAMASLRTLHGANMTYAATSGNGEFAGLEATQGTSAFTVLASVALIDDVLGSANKSSYNFVADRVARSASGPPTFYIAANPISPTSIVRGGNKRFGIATDGVLMFDGEAANLSTPFDAVSVAVATPVAN